MWAYLWLLVTPAVPLHELTHAVVARRWGQVRNVSLLGDEAVDIEWGAGTPAWAVRVAHLAPTICGLLLGLVVLAVVGVPSASWYQGAALWQVGLLICVVLNWLVYTYPSPADRRPFGVEAVVAQAPAEP